jgi:hypothetical protein
MCHATDHLNEHVRTEPGNLPPPYGEPFIPAAFVRTYSGSKFDIRGFEPNSRMLRLSRHESVAEEERDEHVKPLNGIQLV